LVYTDGKKSVARKVDQIFLHFIGHLMQGTSCFHSLPFPTAQVAGLIIYKQ